MEHACCVKEEVKPVTSGFDWTTGSVVCQEYRLVFAGLCDRGFRYHSGLSDLCAGNQCDVGDGAGNVKRPADQYCAGNLYTQSPNGVEAGL